MHGSNMYENAVMHFPQKSAHRIVMYSTVSVSFTHFMTVEKKMMCCLHFM